MATANISSGLLQMWTSNRWSRITTDRIGRALTSKTLVVWCSLNELDCLDSGGVSIGEMKGPNYPSEYATFDGIFYDGAVRKWKTSSNSNTRTFDPASAPVETVKSPDLVMIAAVWDYPTLPNGTITLYRNGQFYASSSTTKGAELTADARLIAGPMNYGKANYFNGVFDEIRLYDTALTAAEVAALYAEGPVASDIVNKMRNFGFDDEVPKWQATTTENTANSDVAWIPMWHRSPDGVGSIFTASKWNYCNPSTWGTRACLETDAAGTAACVNEGKRVYLETIQLGGLKAGCRYKVNIDFLMPNVADVRSFTVPLVEFYDAKAGDVFYSYRAGDFSRKEYLGKKVSCEFTTPAVDAVRTGHPLRVRVGQDFRGREAQEYVGSQAVSISRLSFDNFVITEIAGTVPEDADAVWTATTDGAATNAVNWQDGTLPSGAHAKVRFASRSLSNPTCTSVTLDEPLRAGELAFDAETAAGSVWELKNAGAGNLVLAGANGAAASVAVGSGLAVAETVDAASGLVKTGAGTFQVGAFGQVGGVLDIRGGRLVVGDELAHRWSFNDGTGKDSAGLCDLVRDGNAVFENQGVKIPGSGKLSGSRTGRVLGEHTLIVWTKLLDHTDTKGGAALLVGDPDYGYPRPFDGLVYSEAPTFAQKWSIGSDYWERTCDTPSAPAETASNVPLMIAGTVQRGNDQTGAMRLYRNGTLIENYEKTGSKISSFVTYDAESQILVGPRGWNPSSGAVNWQNTYNGTVDEARIYRKALSTAQIQALVAAGPNAGVDVSAIPALPPTTKVALAAGATLDLNLRNQRVAEFSGAGNVQNGCLGVSGKLTVSGLLSLEESFTVESELVFTSATAGLKTDGALTFASGSSVTIAPAIVPRRSFTMTLFTAGVETDWSKVLNGVSVATTGLDAFVAEPVVTPTAYLLHFRKVGTCIIIR